MASEQGSVTEPSRAAVLGSPISHSLSPVLHTAAYRALGLNWSYDAIDVTQSQFADALAELLSDETLAGLSVTMPLKESALAAADTASGLARQTRAANTLIVRDGKVDAHNTDPAGIVWALTRAGVVHARDGAGVIGAGATARSAIAALAELGAQTVDVVARRSAAIADLADAAQSFGVRVVPHEWTDLGRTFDRPVVVSTVPVGVADAFIDCLPERPAVLLDVVYAPWPTPLASAWQRHGGKVVSGLEMLVGQAGRQVELMTGRTAPLEVMLQAGIDATR